MASFALRCSIGERRKSWPSSSIRSKAHNTALSPCRALRMSSKTARPLSSVQIASPSMRNERPGSASSAATASGKRDVKSLPWRVNSRTPALSRRAMIRKPSCLISWIQPGPLGGALAGDGRHGSMIPNPGRVRSRNDMRQLIERPDRGVESNATAPAASQYSPRSAALRAASFVAAACLPSLAEAEFAAAPRHSRRWSPGWRHSWRRNPLVFVGSFRRCAGPHHRGSGLRTTKTNRPRTPIHPTALGWV